MKTCGDCENFSPCCEICKRGWCYVGEEFTGKYDEACECYDGPNDEPGKPHYQSEYERDNPRDPIIERS